MAEATVTSKGQITIPVEIRQALGLQDRDRVVFTELPNGSVVMRAKTRSAKDLAGLLRSKSGKRVATKDLGFR